MKKRKSRAGYLRDYNKRTGYYKRYCKSEKYKARMSQTKPLWARIDLETHAQIAKKAKADGTSMAETVRTLLEWGLEAEDK